MTREEQKTRLDAIGLNIVNELKTIGFIDFCSIWRSIIRPLLNLIGGDVANAIIAIGDKACPQPAG
jgi:hypothetical protein